MIRHGYPRHRGTFEETCEVPQANLTDAFIRNLKHHERQILYTDANLRGFGLRCSGSVRTFIVVPPNDRTRRKITIGRYGPGGITLQQARQRAAAMLSEIVLGIHKPKTVTFAEAFETYCATHLQTLREGSRRGSERLVRRALPRFGRSELGKIATSELAAFIDTLASTPYEANNCFVAIRAFLMWCVRRGYIENSPLGRLQKPHAAPARDRVFSTAELRSVLSAAFLEGNYNRLIAMLLCTGQRWGQIVVLRERHIDRQNRTLSWPAAEMKTGIAFILPYSNLTASLIEPPFVPFTKTTRFHERFMKQCGVYRWTRHDCRRVYRSVHAQIGTPPHLAERLLSHRLAGPIEQVYDRYRYEPEMRQACGLYEAYLAELVGHQS
jgi:integrase